MIVAGVVLLAITGWWASSRGRRSKVWLLMLLPLAIIAIGVVRYAPWGEEAPSTLTTDTAVMRAYWDEALERGTSAVDALVVLGEEWNTLSATETRPSPALERNARAQLKVATEMKDWLHARSDDSALESETMQDWWRADMARWDLLAKEAAALEDYALGGNDWSTVQAIVADRTAAEDAHVTALCDVAQMLWPEEYSEKAPDVCQRRDIQRAIELAHDF